MDAQDGEVILAPGDVISIPVQVFRGFENVGKAPGYMCSVLGGDDPGRVTWARRPCLNWQASMAWYCWKRAQLIDTRQGEQIPEGAAVMPPTTPEIVKGMRQISLQEMQGCVYLAARAPANSRSELAAAEGIEEIPIIGAANAAEKIGAGKMTWPHSFHLPCLKMSAGAYIARHCRLEEEVIYLYEGRLRVEWPGRQRDPGQGRCADRAKVINPFIP